LLKAISLSEICHSDTTFPPLSGLNKRFMRLSVDWSLSDNGQ